MPEQEEKPTGVIESAVKVVADSLSKEKEDAAMPPTSVSEQKKQDTTPEMAAKNADVNEKPDPEDP